MLTCLTLNTFDPMLSLNRIRGSKPMGFEVGNAELRVYSAERVIGNFERPVRLPEFVDGDNIAAEFVHGVLFLTVPKVQAAQPRRIQIRGFEPRRVAA